LAFKRLKSLLQVGHLKKTDPIGAKAWLQGKLLVAILIEKLIAISEHFPPWGDVPNTSKSTAETMLLAPGGDDAFPIQPGSQSRDVVAGQIAPLGPHQQSIARGAAKAPLPEGTTG
jgi:hypothetical protein